MVEIFEKYRYFRKVLILAEIIEKFRFGWKCSENLIFMNFYKNLDFYRNFRKSQFLSKYRNILVLVEILKNHDFCRNLQKILILVENFVKFRFSSKFSRNRAFWSKFFKNHEHGRYFRKIPILVEIF